MPSPEEIAQLEKEIAAAKAGEPIRHKLETGEEVVGKDWQEVAMNLAKMKVDTTLALRTEKQRAEELSTQVESLRQKPEPVRTEGGGFDPQVYWALVNKNTPDSLAQANLMALGHAFNMKPEEVVPMFTETVRKVDGVYDEIEIAKFKNAHPDFAPTKENSKLILERVQQYGDKWDASTLHRAFKDLVEEQAIKPLDLKEPEKKGEEVRFIPSLNGGGGQGGEKTIEQLAATMTDADLEKLLISKGMLVR